MKKSFLLLAAGLVAGVAQGQWANKSLIFKGDKQAAPQVSTTHSLNTHSGSKTTVGGPGGGRWYDYVDSVLPNNSNVCNPITNIDFTSLNIWQDTTSLYGYSSGTPPYQGVPWMSVGLGLDPFAPNWNDPLLFPAGTVVISAADPYTIDSILIGGFYERNPSKPTIVDTLIVTFVQGNGGSTSNLALGLSYGGTTATNYCVTGLDFLMMYADSANNRAGGSGGAITVPVPTPVPLTTGIYKFPLTINDTATTGTIIGLSRAYPRAGHSDPVINYPVTAGNFVSMSMQFKSGDTWPTTTLPSGYKDTVSRTDGSIKYGNFTPFIAFNGTSPTAEFPPFHFPDDHTSGYFKRYGASDANSVNAYVPNWGWTTGGGTSASALQYPYVWFHTKCTGCVVIGTPSLGVENVTALSVVNATPNPANNELAIEYTAAQNASVTVSLTNMVGQVVATQKSTNGKVVFNTTALPSGLYVYSLESNGATATGRVAVAH